MKAALKLLSWDAGDEQLTLHQGRFVIGRGSDCDYHLDSPLVSRHHCEIVLEGDRLLVRDMGSRNGTFVNGEAVHGFHLLNEGDLLYVAAAVFQVHIPQNAVERAKHWLGIGV